MSGETCYVGIDPGWQSFGICVRRPGEEALVRSYIPSNHKSLWSFCFEIFTLCELPFDLDDQLDSDLNFQVTIERFVPYGNVQSSAGEDTLMVIGALRYMFESAGAKVNLTRAIDWKQKLCKHLVKSQGFSNPSASFDKKFSLAAAKALLGRSLTSDHEADAVCLSFFGEIIK